MRCLTNHVSIIIFNLHVHEVRQLHREFVRAGADVIQAFTFSYDDHLGVEHIKYGVSKVY